MQPAKSSKYNGHSPFATILNYVILEGAHKIVVHHHGGVLVSTGEWLTLICVSSLHALAKHAKK